MADAKAPFLVNNPAASGGGGSKSGPGVLTRDRAQQSGTPDYNKDSVPEGGRSAIPDKSKYNETRTYTGGPKPYKNLDDGEGGGDSGEDEMD